MSDVENKKEKIMDAAMNIFKEKGETNKKIFQLKMEQQTNKNGYF